MKPSRWHRFQTWCFRTFLRGDYEHMQHLIDDVIRLELENKYLRDIIRPNSTPIVIPSVWIESDKAPDYEITTTNNTEEIYYAVVN